MTVTLKFIRRNEMKTFAILTLAILLAGCAIFPHTINTPLLAPTATPSEIVPAVSTAPEPSFLQREFEHLLDGFRADFANAQDAASRGGDGIGQQCFTSALVYVNALSVTPVRLIGVASIAEDLRLKRLAVRKSGPLLDSANDSCAAVFPLTAALRHLHELVSLHP